MIETTIKEICSIKSGKRIPKGFDFAGEKTQHPYIRARDIKDGTIHTDELEYIDERVFEKIKKYIINSGDVAITIVGASIGDIGYANAEVDGYNLTENAVRLTEFKDDVNSKYVFYLLNSEAGQTYMKQVAGGAAQPKLGIYKIESIPVSLPDKNTQDKIVEIISSYDSLIENNQKQIKLLEEAAQRLYKEWFVDLRFPGYETTPVVDGVPEGWSKELIGNIICKVPRTKQIMTSEYKNEGGLPIIDQSRNFIAGYTDDNEARVDFGKPVIVFGDHTRILKYIPFPFAKGADGTQLILSKNDNMPQSLLYLSLVEVDLSNYHYVRHFKYLKAETIIVPTKEIADRFENLVKPIFLKMQKLRDISFKATQARGRLLPKLMSGELEV